MTIFPKHVFVSGAATGMGRSTAEMLLKKGSCVSFIDSNEKDGAAFAKLHGDNRVNFSCGDVSSRKDAKRAFSSAIERFGPPQGMFLGAGTHISGTVLDCSDADWDRIVSINLKGMFLCLQQGLPHLLKTGGNIVLMGSDQTFIGKPKSFLYGLTKGAIGQMTKSLALDFAAYNIRVNAVCPGTICTPMAERAVQLWANEDFSGDVRKAWEEEAKFFPLKRIGHPKDVAALILFLLSEDSSFMTGANIPIDGGYTAQ
jgi:NAD(P)-dependent dehydrogenase (short-subunit alcohol dehydrogenase family)